MVRTGRGHPLLEAPVSEVVQTAIADTYRGFDQRSLLRSIIGYVPAQVVPAAAALALIPVLTHILSPYSYGIYALVVAGVGLLRALAANWLHDATLRFYPSMEEGGQAKQFVTVLALYFLGSVALALLALVAVVVLLRVRMADLAGIAAVLLVSDAALDLSQALLRAQTRAWAYSTSVSLAAVLRLGWSVLGGLLLTNHLAGTLVGRSAASGVAAIATVVAVMVFLGRNSGRVTGEGSPATRTDNPMPGVREFLFYGLPLAGSLLMGLMLGDADRFLLQIFATTSDVGTYSAIYTITSGSLTALYSLVIAATFPLLARLWDRPGGQAEVKRLVPAIMRYFLLLACPGTLGIILVAHPALYALTTPAYASHYGLVAPIALGVFFLGLGQYTTIGLALTKRTGLLLAVLLAASGINVGLNVLLIPHLGSLGAAFSTLAGYAAYAALGAVVGGRYLSVSIRPATLVRITLACIIMGGAVVAAETRVQLGLATMGLLTALGAVAYLGALLAFNELPLPQTPQVPALLTDVLQRAGFPLLVLPVSLLAAALVVVSDKLSIVAIGVLAFVILAFTAREQFLIYAFVFFLLSGLRPFPPMFGYHVEAQYFLLPALLLKAALPTRQGASGVPRTPVRKLLLPIALVLLASVLGLGLDAVQSADGRSVTVKIGDWLKWLADIGFFLALLRIALRQPATFLLTLHRNIFRILFLFAVYALGSALLASHSIASITHLRLTLVNAGPNATGTIAASGLVLVMTRVAGGRFRLRDMIPVVTFALLLVASGSREAVAGCLAGLFALIFYQRRPAARAWYLYALAGIGALVAAVVLLGLSPPTTLSRAVAVYPQMAPYTTVLGIHLPSPIAERLYFQVSGLGVFLSHPILGIGYDSQLNIPVGFWWFIVNTIPKAHDTFVTIAAQQGLVGLTAFLMFVWSAFRVSKAAVNVAKGAELGYDVAVGARCVMIVIMVASLTDDLVYYDHGTFVLFLWMLVEAFALVRRHAVIGPIGGLSRCADVNAAFAERDVRADRALLN